LHLRIIGIAVIVFVFSDSISPGRLFPQLRFGDLLLSKQPSDSGSDIQIRIGNLFLFNIDGVIPEFSIIVAKEEIPRQHWIAVRHGTTAKAPRPEKIVRYRNVELGRTELDLDGVRVPIYDRERTILDAFRQLSRETAIKALKSALTIQGPEKLNLVKLQQYAKKLRVPIEPYLLTATT
jgi:hypothetical protein